ncbi:hypothetical protein GCM10029992_25330 [Glycomyces albus]
MLIQLTQPSSLNFEDDAGDWGQVIWEAMEVLGDQLIHLRSPSLAVFIGSAAIRPSRSRGEHDRLDCAYYLDQVGVAYLGARATALLPNSG